MSKNNTTLKNLIIPLTLFVSGMLFTKGQVVDPKAIYKQAFYNLTMPAVGAYNQHQNNGDGYNSGPPFYGEHTYSGTGIYQGFFGTKP